ncbi:MAG: riboflavin synthase [Candidatus Kapaibacteriales bacterium]
MFTGLIEEIGHVVSASNTDGGIAFTFACSEILSDIEVDSSIAVDGCCLTVTDFEEASFSAVAIEETLRKTTLGSFSTSRKVNLERAIKAENRLGGHIVQGHVDSIVDLLSIDAEGTGTNLTFSRPQGSEGLIVPMGSITINGISLTVSRLEDDNFTVSIIPHTWKNTNISELRVGKNVNIELDMTGKYFKQMLEPYIKEYTKNLK